MPPAINTRHIVSYGGGVNSTAMILHMIQHEMPIDNIVFIDAGAEYKSTLDYVRYFESKIDRPISIISRDEGLYDYCYNRRKIPSLRWRWCTTTFKRRVLAKWLKQFKGYRTIEYVGFDAGEDSRVSNALSLCKPRSRRLYSYPLYFAGIDRDGCKALIAEAGLDVPGKSGCFICPFQTKARLIEMATTNPVEFQKALQLEYRHPENKTIREGLRLESVRLKEEIDLNQDYEPYIPCACYEGQGED